MNKNLAKNLLILWVVNIFPICIVFSLVNEKAWLIWPPCWIFIAFISFWITEPEDNEPGN